LTAEQVEALWDRVKHVCYWGISPNCPGKLTARTRTIDHVIAIVDGGPDTIENVVFACKSCNSAKGTKRLTLL